MLTAIYLCLAAAAIGAGYFYSIPESGSINVVLSLSPYILAGGLIPLIFVSTSTRVLVMTAGVISSFFWLQHHPVEPPQNGIHRTNLVIFSALVPLFICGCIFLSRRGWLTSRDVIVLAALAAMGITVGWDIQRETSYIGSLDSRLLTLVVYSEFLILPPVSYGLYSITFVMVLVRKRMSQNSDEFALLFAFLLISLIATSLLPSPNTVLAAACSLLLILIIHSASQVYGMAYIDELTGLPSRKALNDKLGNLGRNYSICMLDVDHFSQVNNKYGHDTGDEVLKTVAKHIAAVAEGGKAYRYGGEEFAVVFPNRSANVAADAIDEIREALSKYRFTLRNRSQDRSYANSIQNRGKATKRKALKVTFSAGVAERLGGGKPEEVIKHADELLYQAKVDGRNRVYYEADNTET